MKTLILMAFILLFSISLNSNELSWVDTQVQAIKPPRKGMDNNELNKIKDPFIFYKNRYNKKYVKARKKSVKSSVKKSTTSSDAVITVLPQPSKHLVLKAIINKSALINGEWYKQNEYIDSYQISSVNRTSVVLTKSNRKFVLTTSDTKQNLKFK
jgi:type II secretory pathway component PulC